MDTLYDQLLLFCSCFCSQYFWVQYIPRFFNSTFWLKWKSKWNRCHDQNFFVPILFFHSVNGVIINSHLNKFSSNFVFCHSIVWCVHDFHFNSSCSSSEFSALKSRNLCYENDEAVTVNEFTFFIAFKLNHFNNM